MIPNAKQKSVQLHDFSMNPSPEVPRSQFNLSHGRKVPFSFSYWIPILIEFALPGDTWNCNISTAARTAVPLVPVQDTWRLTFASFFCPLRLVWTNAQRFFGEQDNPADSISYTIPVLSQLAGGFPIGSIFDYAGLPSQGQVNAGIANINALPFRAMNRIYNDWMRDENLQNSLTVPVNDGPDATTNYSLFKRGKRFDYFNQALPWPQKGNTTISVPLVGQAPVKTSASATVSGAQASLQWKDVTAGGGTGVGPLFSRPPNTTIDTTLAGATQFTVYPSNLYADLPGATGISVNQIRTSITLQQYLEKDARGGTRYNEYVWNHYKVRTADARLNRPEFIGGGSAPINTIPIAQTSATGLTGATTPIGTLAATGYVGEGRAGFTYSATEHGYLITFVCATADLTYSQGLRRMWSLSTRYDVPVPVFAGLGEQTILNKELYCQANASDELAFGYVPRFDDYRFIPSQIVGIYRPNAAGNIAYWHSSQVFGSLPALNSAYITDDAVTVVQRNFSAGAATLGQQILADFHFDITAARPLPLYGIPGLTRL